MNKLTVLCSAAAITLALTQALPQAADAKHHRVANWQQGYYGNGYVNGYGYVNNNGYPLYSDFGGATIFPDGSFTNNGYSWNGADPAGGWNGHITYPGQGRLYRRIR